MDSTIVSSQEEFNEAVSEMADLIQCSGEIFTLDNDDAAGLELIESLQSQNILILTGDKTTSMKMDDLESFEDEEEVHQFVVFGIQVKNMIVSSPQHLELVFDDRDEFESWESVTFDNSKIEIVIKDDEWNEFDLYFESQSQENIAWLRKYEARLGVDEEMPEALRRSQYSSYEEACSSYSGTNINVGAIIGAKIRAGYYRYGIFGGKNEVISVNPDTDLVEILDHDTFLKGTGLFNGTEVKRMGFSGDKLNKSLKETYTIALSMIGKEMDDEDFVQFCRLDEGDDREVRLMDSSALEFLNDL